MKKPDYEILLGKASAYCSLSEHCIADVEEKLNIWGATDSQIKKIVKYLLMEKYIDPRRFAIAYAHDKFRFNRWGKVKITFMLRAKDIDNDIITDALESIDTEEYQNILQEMITEKAKAIKAASLYEKRGKLIRCLHDKGFEFSEIEREINKIL
ncbi:MAG: RecX family transcriptional regulator [Paludibacter sp.]|nr:RecX family transcriptional regulator [Paludibacter sp.]